MPADHRDAGPGMKLGITRILICIIVVAGLLFWTASAAGIEAALGDTIPLGGVSYGSGTVYLFLTGPNLPSNGVALHDITSRADRGGYTRVSVGDNDRWHYDWNTAMVGGRLDEGTYTIWVSDEPADVSRLRSDSFRTLSVRLRKPGLAVVAAPAATGSASIRSSPDGASVTIGGQERGTTPLDVNDLLPGRYEVTVSKPGYQQRTLVVIIEAGAVRDVEATLVPVTGSLAVSSDPAGARILLDGRDAGISPLVMNDISAGSHTVSAHLSGYTTAEQAVSVPAGSRADVSLVLVQAVTPQGSATPRSGCYVPVTAMVLIVSGVLLALAAFRFRRS